MINRAKNNWIFTTRRGNLLLAFIMVVLAYFVGSRALDTGSLGQWSLVFVTLGLAVHRVVLSIRN